jgi:hypothetical protein
MMGIFIALKSPSPWLAFEHATFGSSAMDMGSSRFTSHPIGRCAGDFYRP